jgi:hypothetical protein
LASIENSWLVGELTTVPPPASQSMKYWPTYISLVP